MKVIQYKISASKWVDDKKKAEEFKEKIRRDFPNASIEEIVNYKQGPNDTIHLVSSGDSFFGMDAIACGIKLTPGMVGHFDVREVNCKVCKRTKLYKELKED